MATLADIRIHVRPHSRRGLLRYWQLYRQRAHLAGLDDAALRDVGLNRADAHAEAARPVWDAPVHWKR